MGLHLLCFNIYNILVNVTIADLQDLNLYHIISIKIRTSLWQQTMTTKYHTFLQLFSVSAYTVRINKRVVYSQSCLYSLSPYYIKKPFQPDCKLGISYLIDGFTPPLTPSEQNYYIFYINSQYTSQIFNSVQSEFYINTQCSCSYDTLYSEYP